MVARNYLVFSGADATVEFASIGLQFPMLEIYEDINFS
jgi:hypothetical protein